MSDEINSPQHYKLFPDKEVIDVIEAALSPDEMRGYLKGNILKYRLRAGEKGPPEKCLGKAGWYRRKLDEHEANWPTTEGFQEIVSHIDVSNADDGFATAPGGVAENETRPAENVYNFRASDLSPEATAGWLQKWKDAIARSFVVMPRPFHSGGVIPNDAPFPPVARYEGEPRVTTRRVPATPGRSAYLDFLVGPQKEDLAILSLSVLTECLKTIQAEFRRRGLAVSLTVEPLRDVKPDDGN